MKSFVAALLLAVSASAVAMPKPTVTSPAEVVDYGYVDQYIDESVEPDEITPEQIAEEMNIPMDEASDNIAPEHIASRCLSLVVDKGSQTATAYNSGGGKLFDTRVSTARKGYATPKGAWNGTRRHKMWYSRTYDNSPMPHSIFYYGGYAVHGTGAIKNLGRPASHGCVRLHPEVAAHFYNLSVRCGNVSNTRITVQ
ncbi:MAG TPA: L,D-transpeptidase [Bdellovibrionales bacterium]|nr:L,D-transpeptidase [Bdellovibrionales bacterium]